MSRKSELRELRSQAAGLDADIGDAERRLADVRDQVEGLAGPIAGLEEEIRALASSASDVQSEILRQTEQQKRLTDDIALMRQEWSLLEDEIRRLEAVRRDTRSKAEEAERQAEQLKHQIETAEHAIRGYESDRAARQQEQTAARVALAETVQRLNGLREAFEKLEADLERGRTEASRMRRHETVLCSRHAECELAALRASAELAVAFRRKDVEERRVSEWALRRDADRARRGQLVEALAVVRTEAQHARRAVSRT